MKTSKRLKSQVCIALLGAGCLIGSTAYADIDASESVLIQATVEKEFYVDIDDNTFETSHSFLPSALVGDESSVSILAQLDLCLASNDTGKEIGVKITSANTTNGPDFSMKSTTTETLLPYTVHLTDDFNNNQPTIMADGEAANFVANSSLLCGSGDYGSRIAVLSDYNGIADLTQGVYEDTLEIEVQAAAAAL